MQVYLNDAVSTAKASSTSSIAWSHTVGTGPRRALYVGIAVVTNGVISITSVTYGAASLTLIDNAGRVASSPLRVGSAIYRLIAPASGTDTITVNFSAAVDAVVVYAMSPEEVGQTTPEGDIDKTTGVGNAPALTLDSSTGDLVMDILAVWKDIVGLPTITVGSGQTQRLNDHIAAAGVVGGGSTEPGGGAITMSWSINTDRPFAYVSCVIQPDRPRLLAQMGVGI
jgi:hypothetical protein